MNKDIDYVGPYRMKSEEFLYSTITVNGNPYRVADAVGAIADVTDRCSMCKDTTAAKLSSKELETEKNLHRLRFIANRGRRDK